MKMETNNQGKKASFTSIFAGLVIILSFIITWSLFIFVLGHPSNFEGEHPVNTLGIIYKGGYVVPFLMGFLLITFIFTIERFITLTKATGKRSTELFVLDIKNLLKENKIDEAITECENQKGSIGNVIGALLHKYKELIDNYTLDKEQKMAALEKELEEAKALEMPILEKNLPILSTIGSVATLVALLGTVLGMIKAFSAMSNAGAPDAAALATGISEALINTAIGIGTSALAIIAYNFFTNKIDTLSYRIEEAAMSIRQTFYTVAK
jgi:biopolymer transport protein ExbB